MFELIVFGTLLVVLIGALGCCRIRRAPTTAGTGANPARPVGAEAPHVAVRVACGEFA